MEAQRLELEDTSLAQTPAHAQTSCLDGCDHWRAVTPGGCTPRPQTRAEGQGVCLPTMSGGRGVRMTCDHDFQPRPSTQPGRPRQDPDLKARSARTIKSEPSAGTKKSLWKNVSKALVGFNHSKARIVQGPSRDLERVVQIGRQNQRQKVPPSLFVVQHPEIEPSLKRQRPSVTRGVRSRSHPKVSNQLVTTKPTLDRSRPSSTTSSVTLTRQEQVRFSQGQGHFDDLSDSEDEYEGHYGVRSAKTIKSGKTVSFRTPRRKPSAAV